MSDFYVRTDIAAITNFTDAGSLVEFPFEAHEQTIHNDNANASAVVELSWDGVNVHARLQGAGPSKIISWADHVRKRLWLRSTGPAGARIVEVLAVTR